MGPQDVLYTSHNSPLFKWCSIKKVHANFQRILMDVFNLFVFWFEMKISIFFPFLVNKIEYFQLEGTYNNHLI